MIIVYKNLNARDKIAVRQIEPFRKHPDYKIKNCVRSSLIAPAEFRKHTHEQLQRCPQCLWF